jgi:Tfp pilus assembly protein PilF
MTASNILPDRAVVPRWRSMATTTALGELNGLEEGRVQTEEEGRELAQARLEWLANRTVTFAAEFASASLVLRQPADALEAAEFLMSNSENASPAALSIAREVLVSGSPRYENDPDVHEAEPGMAAKEVRFLRGRLRREPRNAVAWTDLARAHAVLGKHEKSESAMKVALALAPENRFVLRAAARLFVTRGDAGRAHWLLSGSPAARVDPWLSAAEIAVASIDGRPPRMVRAARQMIESGHFPPHHLTELESALATLELWGGQKRRARKLFEASLEAPNDNSLAQAEWASHHLAGLDLSPYALDEPYAYEARARSEFEVGEWKDAVNEAWSWHYDQPFVSDASVFGSYAAAVGLMDFEEAARLARAGLLSNPGDNRLLNNLAYALLEMDRVGEATERLGQVRHDKLDRQEAVADMATRGLLAYKVGDFDRGRELYQGAIAVAEREGWKDLAAMASLILARQELWYGGEYANTLTKAALSRSAGSQKAWIETWRDWLLHAFQERFGSR